MRRHTCQPRSDWRARVEQCGLTYHSHDNGPYWDEGVWYEFSASEIDQLEHAANTVHSLCIEAAETIVRRGAWDRLTVPAAAIPLIEQSWERDDPSIYGRFDFAFDGQGPPKLLEYNADTPTALLEASVAQWFWVQETRPEWDQFNSIHERLIAAWSRFSGRTVHFAGVRDHAEDQQTLLYLRDTCEQAGVRTQPIPIDAIGWDDRTGRFVDEAGGVIDDCFKLYPWEWLWREEFAMYLPGDRVRWVEPVWKMLLSNKALLSVLWELFPEHPNLLPTHDTPGPLGGSFVRKPRLSREGANVTWFQDHLPRENTEGPYGAEGYVYQALAPIPEIDGCFPICGLWMIDHEAAGLGIREDTRRITGNLSRFVPHAFLP